jgi:hypothetical protein
MRARTILPIFLLLLLSACRREASGPDGPPGSYGVPRLVLAFYYPWWGRADGPSGQWYHWNPGTPRHDVTDSPLLGLYDSNDSALVRRHIRWARAAGIDGFIASWWGPGSFEDRSLRVLLAVAEQEGFRVTILLESPFTPEELREDIHTLLATRATSPAWLRVDGRPVLFVYRRIMDRFTPEEFRRALEGTGAFALADTQDPEEAAPFDGVFSYGPVQDLDGYLAEEPGRILAHHRAGRIYAGAALPGYDDRVIRQPGRFLPRDAGRTLRRMFAAAAGADWVTVTSWNEWHEGTEIEPSLEYGDGFLRLTREVGAAWRLEPVLEPPP